MTVHLECNPDETLVKSLGFTRRQIHHHNDKGRVCAGLIKSTTPCIGLIDEDPLSAQPSYLRDCKEISSQHGLKQLKDKKGNVIVVLQPRLEEWIVEAAKHANVSLPDLGLPANATELKGVINRRLPQLSSLLSELQNRQSPHLSALRDFLRAK